MAGPQTAEREATPQRTYTLQHNDFFRGTAEPRLVEAVVASVRGASAPGTSLGTYGQIPLISKPFTGSDMAELNRTDWQAVRRGSPMVVLRVLEGRPGEEPAVRHIAIGSAERLGIGTGTGQAIKEGTISGIDAYITRLRSDAKRRGNTLEIGAIILSSPLDCLQFVNHGLGGAGVRPVSAQSGTDLSAALETEGRAIVERVDVLTGDAGARTAFYSAPRQGDVVLFLRQLDIPVGDTEMIESTTGGDRVIWMGTDGRPIPRARIEELARTDPEAVPGIPYQVRHSAMFGGTDRRTGRPLVAQSHIRSGNLSVEPLDQYVASYGARYNNFDAVAVISLEFFAGAGGLVASR